MEKPELLFLCHRIPYPPDKGDKIRSYHLLRYLSEHYKVFLGCFYDDLSDSKYISSLNLFCEDVFCLYLNPTFGLIRGVSGLLSGNAMTVPYYSSDKMQAWVNSSIKFNKIHRCVIFSSAMAQYVLKIGRNSELKYIDSEIRTLVDFVDVDSDKWRQYSETKAFPFNYIYRREANCLLSFEKRVAELSSSSFLVSSPEAKLFKNLVPSQKHKINYYNNGVDSEYFKPSHQFTNPYPDSSPVLVFTGAMDYWPNEDAVIWFSENIFPHLRVLSPDLKFYIVGRNPTKSVIKLADRDGITVTGTVPDVRPYLKFSKAVVAPLRIARGIQNKILEAMAMEKIVMTSDAGLEGISAELGAEILLTNTLEDYQEFLPQILQERCQFIGRLARKRVIEDFNWNNTLPKLGICLEGDETRELEHD